jgi:predicted RNA-binding Zn-ribbon protein involved in translation (DUF1610 family)
MAKNKKSLSPGLLKYQAEQKAKKLAAQQSGVQKPGDEISQEEKDEMAAKKTTEKAAVDAKAKAKLIAENGGKEPASKETYTCTRCGQIFPINRAIEMAQFGGRKCCPKCGFPIQK